MSDFDAVSEYYKLVWWQRPFTEEELTAKGREYVATTGLGLDSNLTVLDLGRYMHQRIEPKIRLAAAGKGQPASTRQSEMMVIAGHLRAALEGSQKYRGKYKDWRADSHSHDYSFDEDALLEFINYWESERPSVNYSGLIKAMAELFRRTFQTDPSITISEYAGPSGAFWRFVKLAFENAGATISPHSVHSAVYRKDT